MNGIVKRMIAFLLSNGGVRFDGGGKPVWVGVLACAVVLLWLIASVVSVLLCDHTSDEGIETRLP